MGNTKNILWGVVLILIGVVVAVNSLGIADINIFFSGWWTLFIIIPCFISLFNDDDKTGDFIGLIIGIMLLLGVRNVIGFDLIWKLILPIILVVIGLSLIFKNQISDRTIKEIQKRNKDKGNKDNGYFSTFSDQKIDFEKEEFTGATMNAIFGGIKCDLSEAIIKDDVVIKTCSVFGGITLILPKDVNVRVNSNSIFGGVSGIKKNKKDTEKKTIYINASCIFGGVELK